MTFIRFRIWTYIFSDSLLDLRFYWNLSVIICWEFFVSILTCGKTRFNRIAWWAWLQWDQHILVILKSFINNYFRFFNFLQFLEVFLKCSFCLFNQVLWSSKSTYFWGILKSVVFVLGWHRLQHHFFILIKKFFAPDWQSRPSFLR